MYWTIVEVLRSQCCLQDMIRHSLPKGGYRPEVSLNQGKKSYFLDRNASTTSTTKPAESGCGPMADKSFPLLHKL